MWLIDPYEIARVVPDLEAVELFHFQEHRVFSDLLINSHGFRRGRIFTEGLRVDLQEYQPNMRRDALGLGSCRVIFDGVNCQLASHIGKPDHAEKAEYGQTKRMLGKGAENSKNIHGVFPSGI